MRTLMNTPKSSRGRSGSPVWSKLQIKWPTTSLPSAKWLNCTGTTLICLSTMKQDAILTRWDTNGSWTVRLRNHLTVKSRSLSKSLTCFTPHPAYFPTRAKKLMIRSWTRTMKRITMKLRYCIKCYSTRPRPWTQTSKFIQGKNEIINCL